MLFVGLKFRYFDAKGFSLVEILVSLSLTSVLILAMSHIFIKATKRSVNIQKKSIENILKTNFINYIMNSKNCNKEFANYYLPPPSLTGVVDPLSNPVISCNSDQVPIQEEEDEDEEEDEEEEEEEEEEEREIRECNLKFAHYKGYGDSVSIEVGSQIEDTDLEISTFKMARKPGAVVESIKGIDGSILKERHFVRIYLGFTNKKNNKKLKVSHVDLLVTVNPSSKKIESCGDLDLGYLCHVMGGRWDSVDSKCIPSSQCWVRGVYVSMNSSNSSLSRGSSTVNPFTGSASCEGASTTAMKMGEYAYSYQVYFSKKYRTVTDTYESYICLQCNY